MYQIYLKMYLRFQSPFLGGEQLLITFQGSQKDQMDHKKGIRVPVAQWLD